MFSCRDHSADSWAICICGAVSRYIKVAVSIYSTIFLVGRLALRNMQMSTTWGSHDAAAPATSPVPAALQGNLMVCSLQMVRNMVPMGCLPPQHSQAGTACHL